MSMPFHAANRVRMVRAADTVTGSSGLNSPLPLPAAQVEGGVAAIKMGNRDIGSCLTRRIITNAAVVIHIEYAFIKIGHTAAVGHVGIMTAHAACDGAGLALTAILKG